jgi:hypothetical protein
MTEGPDYPRHSRDDEDQPWQWGESDDSIADVFNRFSFDSGRSRRRRREPEIHSAPEYVERERPWDNISPPALPPPAWDDAPDPQPIPERETPLSRPRPLPRPEPPQQPAVSESGDVAASSIRSYAWTGGRTKSNFKLELETLVSTSDSYRPGPMGRHEHQSIAELCQHPRSVAEVGALLGVPVGVARVLLADMAELGWITVHHTVTDGGSAPHLMLMERVLSGLRRL